MQRGAMAAGFAVAMVVSACGMSRAADYRVGDRVVVMRDGNLTVDGNRIVDKVFVGLVLTVNDVNGDWLWVSNGKPGWLSAQAVVPLDRRAIERLTGMFPDDPAVRFYRRALVWEALGEIDIAIGDVNAALGVRPDAAFYGRRGTLRLEKKDYDQAIADFGEAIRLDPASKVQYNNRGNAWLAKGDYDRAIADYSEAIRLDPRHVYAIRNRGVAYRSKQDYDRAIADFTEALRLDPKSSGAAFDIAVTSLLRREPTAADRFQAVIDMQGWTGDRAVYAVILGSQAARLAGDGARGERFLADSAGTLKPDWPEPVVRFLRGDLDEAGLLALATDDDKRTEARCFLGLQELIAGRPDVARSHFEWVRDHGNRTFTEYDIALAELKRLDGP